jgi:hypothetical protein
MSYGSLFITCTFTVDEVPKMASHVLQWIFLADTGFRFAIAHYPAREAVAGEIYTIFWELVSCLMDIGFTVNNFIFVKINE